MSDTMKIVMLFAAAGPNGVSRAGDILELPNDVGASLIREGYAKPVGGATPEELRLQVEEMNRQTAEAAAAGAQEELEAQTRTDEEARELAARQETERQQVEQARRDAEAATRDTVTGGIKADPAVLAAEAARAQAERDAAGEPIPGVGAEENAAADTGETASNKRRKS